MGERTHTPGPWFVSGVRFRMNGSEWHSVNRYDEAKKQDQNIACIGFDPRTGDGLADARLIAAAPDMFEALKAARQFIANGVELGFIRMPDADTPDPAHDTLPAIEAALAKVSPHV